MINDMNTPVTIIPPGQPVRDEEVFAVIQLPAIHEGEVRIIRRRDHQPQPPLLYVTVGAVIAYNERYLYDDSE